MVSIEILHSDRHVQFSSLGKSAADILECLGSGYYVLKKIGQIYLATSSARLDKPIQDESSLVHFNNSW